MNLTASFVARLKQRFERGLDAHSRAAATSIFVDGISVAALGAHETGPGLLAELACETGARAEATLIARSARVGMIDAARVNGAAMHVLDYEPMWNPANHSVSTVLPALLALAEREAQAGTPALGERLLTALALGIEAQARLRTSSGQFEPGEFVFHPPSAVGPIGSAIACGLFLGIPESQLAHAVGIAASRSGGLLINVGSMTKALHCGGAAAAGLDSVLLAARGFTADSDALAGPRGFAAAFFGDKFQQDRLVAPIDTLHIVEPGPAYKLYPSQYGTHFIITAAREARRQLREGAVIESVRIDCPLMPYVDRPAPATGLAGKFSFQYAAAIGLLDGDVRVESFSDKRRFAPDLVDLLPRITLVPNPAAPGRFDKMCVGIAVTCRGGTVIETECDGPPGIWGKPARADRLQAKALDCLVATFGAAGSAILDQACTIEASDGAAFLELMSDLAQHAVPQKAANG